MFGRKLKSARVWKIKNDTGKEILGKKGVGWRSWM